MQAIWAKIRAATVAFLCLSVFVWSVAPSFTHTPTVIETIQEHLEMAESHGHSHGFEEDLYWAMHGHSHDVADHDHSPVALLAVSWGNEFLAFNEPWIGLTADDEASQHFRIERPPRV